MLQMPKDFLEIGKSVLPRFSNSIHKRKLKKLLFFFPFPEREGLQTPALLFDLQELNAYLKLFLAPRA